MKGVSTLVWIAITLFAAAVVIGLIGYWFFGWGGRASGGMSQAECQLKKQQACEAWKNSGWSDTMHEKYVCVNGQPKVCCADLGITNGLVEKDLKVSNGQWWDCIAPGCRQKYNIKVMYRVQDCGAV